MEPTNTLESVLDKLFRGRKLVTIDEVAAMFRIKWFTVYGKMLRSGTRPKIGKGQQQLTRGQVRRLFPTEQ